MFFRLPLLPLVLLSGLLHAQQLPLMPWPRQLTEGEGQLLVGSAFEVVLRAPNGLAGRRVPAAVQRLRQRIAERTAIDLFRPAKDPEVALFVSWERPATLGVGEDESYTLDIDAARIDLRAATDLGVLRGLSTIYQLLLRNEAWYFPQLRMADSPRFPWRGLLMDVCRHWMPREVILRQLDAMELVKMNVLHLHLTEDQGFRIESRLFPELHEQGGEGSFFTQEDIRFIIQQADLRGIRVIPEFDLPGHATSWFTSHPELASGPGPFQIATTFGVLLPTFDPTREETYVFLDQFLGEMAVLFPDPYMHIGGDENNGKQWDANPAIQVFKKEKRLKDNHALQAHFNARLAMILEKHGKRMIGWDEIAEGELPADVTIQSWRGKEGLVAAAKAGRDVILSNGYYIDLCQPASFHYANDPLPEGIALTPDQQKHVLGGEATMWSELVDARNVDTRIWPRTAAIAERLWSPREANDVDDMYDRLEMVSAQLEAIGLRHKSAQLELLRLIAGSDGIDALKQLVDVIAPVQGYKRHSLRPGGYTTHTPLTSLVDAAVPDPMEGQLLTSIIMDHLKPPDPNGTQRVVEVDGTCERYRQAIFDVFDAVPRSYTAGGPGEAMALLERCLGSVGPALDAARGKARPTAEQMKVFAQLQAEIRGLKSELTSPLFPAFDKLFSAALR